MNKKGFPGGSDGKKSACSAGDLGSILGWEDPLEKGMATHSSILAWRITWTEEPGRLQSMGHKVQDTTERLSLSTKQLNYFFVLVLSLGEFLFTTLFNLIPEWNSNTTVIQCPHHMV